MRDALTNLWRRKLRSVITIFGIVIGAFALTVMGAMSERIRLLADGAIAFYDSRIIVQPRFAGANGLFGQPIPASLAKTIAAFPGVDRAYPTVYLPLAESFDADQANMTYILPPLVKGITAEQLAPAARGKPIELANGRFFDDAERGVVLLGAHIARARNVSVGEHIVIYEEPFKVVGIMATSLTPRDTIAFVPLVDAQKLLARSLPQVHDLALSGIQGELRHVDVSLLASQIEVIPKDLGRSDAIADRINDSTDGVIALKPGVMAKTYRSNLLIFDVIVFGSAVIAVIVGGLAVFNTMVMAISERRFEIGVKRALGASAIQIIEEFLFEAVVIGLLGGLLGLGAGFLAVEVFNTRTVAEGLEIFAITPRLCLLVVLVTTLLGALAGMQPAIMAARLDPVRALRAT